jgi:hypothetical protein
MAKRNTEEQMKLFEEGGLKDEGGSVDPVSGNDVPSGSTQAEVRDDIPAQLSEGEFVFPADVVRYIGLENLMTLRSKAKQGLGKMEQMGQMGNSDEATIPDDAEFDAEIDALIDSFDPNDPSTIEFASGGVVKAQAGFAGQFPQQQYSYGYGTTTTPYGYGATPPTQVGATPSPYPYVSGVRPDYRQFISRPARVAGVEATQQEPEDLTPLVENKQYIGPNGEIITVTFIDGVPQIEIPAGYRPYDPTEEPTVEEPEVEDVYEPTSSSAEEREREEAEQARMDKERSVNSFLGDLDVDGNFRKEIEKDPFMTGELANPFTGITQTFSTVGARTDLLDSLVEELGINPEDVETSGPFGALPGAKYDLNKVEKELGDVVRKVKEDGVPVGKTPEERKNFINEVKKAYEEKKAREEAARKAAAAKKAAEDAAAAEATRQAQIEADTQAAYERALALQSEAERKAAEEEYKRAVRDAYSSEGPSYSSDFDSSDAPGGDPAQGVGGGTVGGQGGGLSGTFSKGGLSEQTAKMLSRPKKQSRAKRKARR